MTQNTSKFRIAALGDLHTQTGSVGMFRNFLKDISQKSDALVLCGDLTDHGHKEEAIVLAEELRFCSIPIVAVLGNHDFAAGEETEIKKILSNASVYILDEEPLVLSNVGFAGVKGFCGGYDKYMLRSYGEEIIKRFVYETIDEVTRLENSLTQLDTPKKVVVLHYSPIRQTCEGEPLEVLPFTGSSRLAEPINSFNATIALHGHVHNGIFKGKTNKGIPVYNVTKPLLEKINPQQPYALIEI